MGNCPLHLAAQHGQMKALQLLAGCEKAFSPNTAAGGASPYPNGTPSSMANRLGQLPLHLAAYQGCLACCRELVKHDPAALKAGDRRKLKPAKVALKRGHQVSCVGFAFPEHA